MLRLADATETTAKVWVRRTEAGVMTVECNGQTFTGTTLDPVTEDGCGICVVTGLAANTSYPFVVKVAGVQVDSGTLKTTPQAGSTFTIGTGYCFDFARPQTAIEAMRERFDPALSVFLGDNLYLSGMASTRTDNGETFVQIGNAGTFETESQAMSALHAHYRYAFRKPEIAALFRHCPMYFITDDHERPGDNWDYTIANANAHTAWATTQQMVDDMGLWCLNAFHTYCGPMPENSHASRDTGWPVSKQLYYDKVVGDAHLIFLESIEYGQATGGAFTVRIGDTQLAWLQAVLLASTSTWKIVFCGGTDWSEFGSVDNAFNTWLVANGIKIVYVTGDLHAPCVCAPSNMLVVRSGPVGASVHANLPDGYGASVVYKQLGNISMGATNDEQRLAAGYITVNGTSHLDIGMIGDDGNVFWRCRYTSDGVDNTQMRFG